MTATRGTLIEKLVVSLHLNVLDRQMLGSNCVSFEEVAAVVKRLFERDGVFPTTAQHWQPGKVVLEGHFLVRCPDGKVQLAWQRGDPVRPTELADKSSSEYDDVDKAVSRFIQCEWSRGIDGIALTPR